MPDWKTSRWAEESPVLWEDLPVSWRRALELPFRYHHLNKLHSPALQEFSICPGEGHGCQGEVEEGHTVHCRDSCSWREPSEVRLPERMEMEEEAGGDGRGTD